MIWEVADTSNQQWTFEKANAHGKYYESKSGDMNCLGYCLFKYEDIGCRRIDSARVSSDYTQQMINYIKTTHKKNCYQIASYTAYVPDNMYRMAFRLGAQNGNKPIDRFHVIHQLSDGRWAGKNSTAGWSKVFANTNPSTTAAMWENDHYPQSQGTIYFAVEK